MNRGHLRVGGNNVSRSVLLAAAVTVWGARLGIHLFERIMNSPKDPRLDQFLKKPDEKWFDKSKSNFPISLAGFWTIQVRLYT